MRLLQHISDSEEEDPLTYGVMPPELKAEGLCEMAHVRWEGSAVRAGLLDEGDAQSAYMMRIRGFFLFCQNTLPFSNTFCTLLLRIPTTLSQ